ncbi:MAG: hypothetical protein QM597_03655 [Aeromicrobium sp.]|uniref:divisome protein SepX/GlpR n=1 Tax=Aeromicrobium sp. TaxID=1871063 RepID=UPI0039E66646
MIGGASGVIVAVVVILWVAYVVPLALRRYDEAVSTSDSQGTESALGSLTSLRRVITRAGRRTGTEAVELSAPVGEGAVPQARLERPSARLAARRRRRVLIALLTALVVLAVFGAVGTLSPLWTAVPAALILAWLVTCRIQVRRELGLGRRAIHVPPAATVANPVPDTAASAEAAAEAAAGGTAADEVDTLVVSDQFEDVEPDHPRVMEPAPLAGEALDEKLAIAVPSPSTTGEALWDPLPVTQPTYIRQPRVGRTVRTVSLPQVGQWWSGHVEGEGAELPGRESGKEGPQDGPREAVGH